MVKDNLPIPSSIEKSYLVTHRDCLDGSACSIIFALAGGKKENIVYIGAGGINKLINSKLFKSNEFIIMADIGVNTDDDIDALERRGRIVLLDHHKTSIHLAERSWAEIESDNLRCGSKMLYDYLVRIYKLHGIGNDTLSSTNLYDDFIKIVDDHDRWLSNRSFVSDQMALFMTFFGQKQFVELFSDPKKRIIKNVADGYGKVFFDRNEEYLLQMLEEKRDRDVNKTLKKVNKINVLLNDSAKYITLGVIISSDPNISFVLNRVLEENKDVDVACEISLERGSVSLRSRNGNPDVSKFAAHFGGGGHASAAGHKLPSDIIQMIIGHIYG